MCACLAANTENFNLIFGFTLNFFCIFLPIFSSPSFWLGRESSRTGPLNRIFDKYKLLKTQNHHYSFRNIGRLKLERWSFIPNFLPQSKNENNTFCCFSLVEMFDFVRNYICSSTTKNSNNLHLLIFAFLLTLIPFSHFLIHTSKYNSSFRSPVKWVFSHIRNFPSCWVNWTETLQ